MTEQELLDAIRASAEDVEAPEQLDPETIRRQLDKKGQVKECMDHTGRNRKYPWKQLASVAAVLVLAVAVTAVVKLGAKKAGDGSQIAGGPEVSQEAAPEQEMTAGGAAMEDSLADGTDSTGENGDAGAAASKGSKQNAGDMFTVARDYEEVYALLEENQAGIYDDIKEDNMLQAEAAVDDAAGAVREYEKSSEDFAASESAASDTMRGHSRTNVQTAGVDESDIVKTDGRFIYRVCADGVIIIDISGERMANAGRIRLEDPGARVMEMYVQGDTLNLILQQEDTGLEQQEPQSEGAAEDVFALNAKNATHLLTYDISDRSKPVLVGDMAQDGAYYTSRKIGSIVYLFTTEYKMEEIPEIGSRKVAYDCIYLPKRGAQGLLVSSVDIGQPEQTLDHVMVVNDYVNIYVSTGAMYLYQTSWQESGTTTQIAKFTLDQGTIQAVGAVSVKGEIRDTFAIHEGSKTLRVLTTDWGEERQENNLFVLDEKLKLLGSLQGLAPGEQIYSARFLGDMAYFVTYRNTDPLFAVDLSSPAEPKVLSELKITGFSEYLHFWGEDKLLGIGYETDPDSGRQQGMKLTMFDISNPAELGVIDSIVLKGLDYSPALYEYKTVLADSSANLFGFAGVDYQERGEKAAYYLYQWGEGGFERLLKEELEQNVDTGSYRGLYSGAQFYLAGPDGITAYDREHGYEKKESLSY